MGGNIPIPPGSVDIPAIPCHLRMPGTSFRLMPMSTALSVTWGEVLSAPR
jgi:hypothetical protein